MDQETMAKGFKMRRFFKTVLFAGLPFGILMGLAGAESVGDFFAIMIVFGLPFGVVLGAVLSGIQWWAGRRSRASGGVTQSRARAERTIALELSSPMPIAGVSTWQ